MLKELIVRILPDSRVSLDHDTIQSMFDVLVKRKEASLETLVFRGVSGSGQYVYPPTLRLLGRQGAFKGCQWPNLQTIHIVHCSLQVDDEFLYALGVGCPVLQDLRLCDRQAARKATTTLTTVKGMAKLTAHATELETVWLVVNDDHWKDYASYERVNDCRLRHWNPLASEMTDEHVPYAIIALMKMFPRLVEVTSWSTALTSEHLDEPWSVQEDTIGLEAENRVLAARWRKVHEGIQQRGEKSGEPQPRES